MCHFIKMSNAKCVVARCRSEKRNDVNLSFHQFPSNPDLKSKWIRAILRNGGLSKGDEHDYSLKTDCVCSLHFQTTSYKMCGVSRRLHSGAVPVFFQSDWLHSIQINNKAS